jgi:transcriptional/translational regulatory protein YebC/TACO1
MAAIEAGAQDFEAGEEEGVTLFITDTTDLDTVARPCRPRASRCCRPSWATRPRTPSAWAACPPKQQEEVQTFLAGLENDDDVQHVFVGLVD